MSEGEGRIRNKDVSPKTETKLSETMSRAFASFTSNLASQSKSAFTVPGLGENLSEDPEDRELLAETKVIEVRGGKKISVTKADLLLERLTVLRDLLSTGADAAAARKSATALQAAAEKTLQQNLTTIFETQRPLEKSLRELDTFYKAARMDAQDNNLPVHIVNATGDELRKNDRLFTELSDQIAKESAFALDKNIGLIVVPTWLRGEVGLKKFGELARDAKAMLYTDLKDFPTFEEAVKLFQQGGELQSLKGLDDWKAHVVIAGNHLRVREKNRHESGKLGDLYTSPAMVLAAKVFHGDDAQSMATPQANEDFKILLETENDVSMRPRWILEDRKQSELFADCVIPVVSRGKNQWVFWGVETLSSETYSKQYTVQRVRNYIEKCLIEYLNGRTFTENTQSKRDAFRDHLSRFIARNSGEGRILDGGRVIHVTSLVEDGRERPDAMDIKLELKYKFATKLFELTVVPKEEEFKATGEQGSWKTKA